MAMRRAAAPVVSISRLAAENARRGAVGAFDVKSGKDEIHTMPSKACVSGEMLAYQTRA